MQRLLACAGLLLVLGALVPPMASAAGGLEFDLASHPGTALAGTVVVEASYVLDYPASRPVVLGTSVRVAGVDQAHTAHWNADGTPLGSSSKTTAAKAGPLPAQSEITISWQLGPQAAGARLVLQALVREDLASTGGQAGGTTVADTATFELAIIGSGSTSTGTFGGGGGGGGGGAGGLAQVTGLQARDITAQGLTLSWDAVPGAAGYRVYRSLQTGFEPGPGTLVAAPVSNSHQETGLSPGTEYHYRVRAVDAANAEGAVSAQLSVRTTAGSDTTPPTQVAGLRLAKATGRSLALAWEPADDAQGGVSYEVHRSSAAFTPAAANRIARTSTPTYTDTAVVPSTAYFYIVRAIDGAGNLGPASDLLRAVTLAPDADDLRPPAILRFAFTGGPTGWTASWATDEPAESLLTFTGAGGTRTLHPDAGVSFAVALGELEPGRYTFSVAATDDLGGTSSRSGSFAVEAGAWGRFELFADDAAARVAQAFTVSPPQGLFFVDQDLDGRPDRLFDATATLAMEHAMPGQGRFLLSATGRSALLTTVGTVEPVERRTASVVGDEAGEAVRSVTVRVPNKGGWIVASVVDPHPGLTVLAVQRSDGSELPAEAVWRDGRTLRFLDDPDTTYRILYDNAGRSGDDGSAGGHWLPSWALWVAVGVGGMLAGMALMALVLRRRA